MKNPNPLLGRLGQAIDLGDGLKIPERIENWTFTDSDLPYDITATFVYDKALGRFVCEALTTTRRTNKSEPVTTEGLRRIPVAALLRLAVQLDAIHSETDERGITKITPLKAPPADMVSEGPTDENLRWVARMYRLASACGSPPIRAISEGLDLPPTTASHWVKLARSRKFLGKALPRRAGEVRGRQQRGRKER